MVRSRRGAESQPRAKLMARKSLAIKPRKRARAEAASTDAASSTLLAAPEARTDELRPALAALWRAGELCDVEIVVDGRTFPAHRVVLAAASECLRAQFASSFSDSARVVTLHEVDASAIASVIEYCYLRSCSVPDELLQPVLQAACRLQIPTLQEAAESAIIDRLGASSCLDAWDLGDRLSLPRLVTAAKSIALAKFESLPTESPEAFSSMPCDALESLLRDDNLAVEHEETVFQAFERWLQQQTPALADDAVGRLLSHVRFPLMARAYRLELEQSNALARRHVAVLAVSYREAMDAEKTPRTTKRRRKLCVFNELGPRCQPNGGDVVITDSVGYTGIPRTAWTACRATGFVMPSDSGVYEWGIRVSGLERGKNIWGLKIGIARQDRDWNVVDRDWNWDVASKVAGLITAQGGARNFNGRGRFEPQEKFEDLVVSVQHGATVKVRYDSSRHTLAFALDDGAYREMLQALPAVTMVVAVAAAWNVTFSFA
eukprot:SAG31_NODE_1108_length_9862_cov_5.407662_3_plen_490_part_00